ncbi:hypothetical protein AHMF7605_22680 [Adhaeribacter arboris]|uniref:Uncharacterized protein n=1 Tax=Adhaeribacter arboris TaxID=2072846 RepID=A0A2T2YKS6_9BACT|nr:hypothetical protein AHMF7605_22680 [Adhaeribacter arboris]
MYVCCPETDPILTYSCGRRSAKTVRELVKKLEAVKLEEYCTNHRKAFPKVLSSEKHIIGKAYIKIIEGLNICIRTRTRKSARKNNRLLQKEIKSIGCNGSIDSLQFNYF